MAWYNPTTWFMPEKVTDNLLDKDNGLFTQVGSWIGNMNFTEEERAEMNERMATGVSDFVAKTLSENTIRSKARRDIALLWIKFHLLLIFMTVIVAPFNPEVAKFWWSIATTDILFYGTLSVIAFFFGPYMIGSHLDIGKISAGKGKE